MKPKLTLSFFIFCHHQHRKQTLSVLSSFRIYCVNLLVRYLQQSTHQTSDLLLQINFSSNGHPTTEKEQAFNTLIFTPSCNKLADGVACFFSVVFYITQDSLLSAFLSRKGLSQIWQHAKILLRWNTQNFVYKNRIYEWKNSYSAEKINIQVKLELVPVLSELMVWLKLEMLTWESNKWKY